jgi:uncharacterized protein YdhG (YjbR/CyaY superfamily)
MTDAFGTIDDYISSFPADIQLILSEVRRTVRGAAPEAEEKISYQMPTLTLNGSALVHFAAWKHHIGMYPVPAGDEVLGQQLAPYVATGATARFPLDKPIPYDLIERMVTTLVRQRMGAPE